MATVVIYTKLFLILALIFKPFESSQSHCRVAHATRISFLGFDLKTPKRKENNNIDDHHHDNNQNPETIYQTLTK